MVDFQSRDTRRGPSDDEADDEESEDEADGDVTDAETEPADEREPSDPEPNAADRDEEESPAGDAQSPSETTEPTGPANRESGRRTDEAGATGERDPLATDASPSDPASTTTDQTAETRQGSAEPATGVSGTGSTAAEPEQGGQVDGTSAATGRSTETGQAAATDEPQTDTAGAADREQSAAAADHEEVTGADNAPIPVDVAVVTIGTTDEHGGDPVGESLVATLEADGHTVATVERLRGDYDGVQQAVDTLVGRDDVETVVTAGGLGLDPADATIEAVHPLFEKALPGFGEAYRSLLSEHIGTGIVAVRATAGLADGVPVFCLPGDEQAARFGVEEIVTTEAGRLVAELR